MAGVLPALNLEHGEDQERGDRHDQRLPEQADARIHLNGLAHIAIGGEGPRHEQRQYGQMTYGDDLVDHPQHREPDGDGAQAREALTGDEHAHGHIHQGIDVIAQRGFQHMAGIDREDVDPPVGPDQKRGAHQHQQRLAVIEHGQSRPQPATDIQDRQQDGRRPDHALQHDLGRVRERQELVEDRRQAPDEIARKGGERSLFGVETVRNRRGNLAHARHLGARDRSVT